MEDIPIEERRAIVAHLFQTQVLSQMENHLNSLPANERGAVEALLPILHRVCDATRSMDDFRADMDMLTALLLPMFAAAGLGAAAMADPNLSAADVVERQLAESTGGENVFDNKLMQATEEYYQQYDVRM
jgi:hypothetical protein